MKKPIFYAVVRTRSHLARGYFELLEATTERGRQVYGRDAEGCSTHVAARDVLKRLETREEADALLVRAETIKSRHRRGIETAKRALRDAERAETRELDALVLVA